MNSTIQVYLSSMLIFLGFQSLMGQDAPPLYISEGVEVSAQKLMISLDGLSLIDQGKLEQDSASFRFYSLQNEDKQYLKSNAAFFNLQLALGGKSLQLESDLRLEQGLELESGLLNLNSHTLYLEGEASQILGENERNRIMGEGMIEKISYLSFPRQAKPGNMGLEISVEDDLGLTSFRRIQKLSLHDSLSIIERQYEVVPSLQTKLPISVSLDYHQAENPFTRKQALKPMQEKNNHWAKLSYFTDMPQKNKMEIVLPPIQKDWHLVLSPEKRRVSRGPQLLDIGPNPFNNQLSVNWGSRDDRAVNVQLYATGGILVYSQRISAYQDSFIMDNLGELAAGMYVLKIVTDTGMIISQTLLKENRK